MPEQGIAKIAVFIDFENIALSADNHFGEFDLGLLLKAIQQRGRVTLKRAYGDWSRLSRYRDALRESAVELVQLYSYGHQQGGKNRADIRLAIDVMESLFTFDYIDTVVIVSGDSDFSSLMSKAREYGKYTIGLGVKASTSDLLIKACDDFIFYDDLVEASYLQIKGRREEVVLEPAEERAPETSEAPAALTAQAAPASGVTIVKPLASTAAAAANNEIQAPINITVISAPAAPPEAAVITGRSERDWLRYFFDDLRMPLIPPEVRSSLLAELLAMVEPGKPLNEAINRLKAKYDVENVYRKREEIRNVAKLAYHAGLLDCGPERPSLGAFVRRVSETDSEQANRRADQTLLRIALEANLRLTPRETAAALFAPAHDESYSAELLEELEAQGLAEDDKGQYFIKQTGEFERLLQAPELYQVKLDLDHQPLSVNELFTKDEVDRLFEKASQWRRTDFQASSSCALQGVKIMTRLYAQREPGLGTDEFRWAIASYCSSRAGVSFRGRDHVAARNYYLAFFWLVQEGDYAWELLRPLLPSLSSYFWMTLSHELRIRVGAFTGQTAPGDAVVALVKELNGQDENKLQELASDLAAVNAAQLRSLIAQIESAASSDAQQRALLILNNSLQK
jgi:uncharacterized LabA/DUF88 family protein